MHLTKSVDYAVIMDGEIEMHLDDGSRTILRQGTFASLSRFGTNVFRRCSDTTRYESPLGEGEGRKAGKDVDLPG
jgi:hypothetical protein